MNKNMRGMLPIGWGLGDSFGSIELASRARDVIFLEENIPPGMGAILT